MSLSGVNKLKSLVEIDIRENLISGINDEISLLFSLQNLEILLMSNNPIQNFNFTTKCKIPMQLRVLDFTNTSIDSKNTNNIFASGCFQNLKSLTLDGNNIKDTIGEIKGLKNLEYLKLSSNFISTLDGIQYIKNLKQLILFNNEIKYVSDLRELKHLKIVNLKGNYLCENTENLGSYLYLQNINKLYIGGNPKNLLVRNEFLPNDCIPLSKKKCPFGEESKKCIFD